MGKSGVLMVTLIDTLTSVITAIVQHTGIREHEVITIRMHPALYFHLNKELTEHGMSTLDSSIKKFMGIPIIMDMDVWLTFENRPRIGWR